MCFVGNSPVNVSPAIEPYFDCLENAGDTTAFVCRCTLKMRNCLTNVTGGNCTTRYSRERSCNIYLWRQNLDCSETLCKLGASMIFDRIHLLLVLSIPVLVWFLSVA